MAPLLFAALLAVLGHQSQLRVSIIDAPVTEIHTTYGETVESSGAYGWVDCVDGEVTVLVHNGNPGTFLHEALHASDCVDDGTVNGSLLPHPPTEADAAHEWVGWAFTHQAEAIEIMAAGAVAGTGRVR